MEIKIVQTKKEQQDAYDIRRLVFVNEQGVSEEEEMDHLEEEAIHFVGYQNGKPIAACRMRFVDVYAKLERLCIVKEERKNGFGKEMILCMEKVAREKGYKRSKLNGQTYIEGFYQHLGYETISGKFMDAGIPHIAMQKTL